MIGVILNLIFYISGLLALAACNFVAIMHLDVTQDASVIALQLVSPVIFWAEVFVFNYFFEGMELLTERTRNIIATADKRLQQKNLAGSAPTTTSLPCNM